MKSTALPNKTSTPELTLLRNMGFDNLDDTSLSTSSFAC